MQTADRNSFFFYSLPIRNLANHLAAGKLKRTKKLLVFSEVQFHHGDPNFLLFFSRAALYLDKVSIYSITLLTHVQSQSTTANLARRCVANKTYVERYQRLQMLLFRFQRHINRWSLMKWDHYIRLHRLCVWRFVDMCVCFCIMCGTRTLGNDRETEYTETK